MVAPTGRTPNLDLPYPIPDDDVDVPRDVKALADKLDGPYAGVTLLPSSPTNGQLAVLQTADMLALDARWLLRWNAARSKWLPEGGPPMDHHPVGAASIGTISTTATPLAFSPTVQCKLPMPGKYIFEWGADAFFPVNSAPSCMWGMSPQGGGIPILPNNPASGMAFPAQSYGLGFQAGAGFAVFRPGERGTAVLTVTGAAPVITLMYNGYANSGNLSNAWMRATPLVLG